MSPTVLSRIVIQINGKQKKKHNFFGSCSVALVTFQVLNSYIWLLAIILDITDTYHFYRCRKSYRTG